MTAPAPKPMQTDREQFEAWFNAHWNEEKFPSNSHTAIVCWEAWQAARRPQQSAEPVAWRYEANEGKWGYTTDKIIDASEPLYLSPGPSELVEGWMPIESAPKTGEHILVAEFNTNRIGFGFCGGKKQSMMTVAHWWDNPGEEGWYASVDSVGEYPFPATHWKQLEELK